MYTIEVPGLPPTLNAFYSGKHWSYRKREADQWHLFFSIAFKQAGLPKPLQWPLTVSVTLYSKRQPRDSDGAVMAAKFAQDALVNEGYLPNDTPQYIPTVILNSKKSENGEDKTVVQLL